MANSNCRPAELDDDSVALELDRDAQASIDNFAGTDVGEQSNESVTGKFDSRGLNIGSGARKLEPIGLDAPAEKLKPEPLDEEPEVIVAPKLAIDDQPTMRSPSKNQSPTPSPTQACSKSTIVSSPSVNT